jgi:pimeloyl-ACP methyl ester carboxylesterase
VKQVQFALPAGTFHALEGQGERRLVFLHGFPDHPPTGKAFFAELEARGHHVLAPWLRGYAPSPRRGPYDLLTLADDIISLIDEWSPDAPVDLVGHDWGGVLTYLVCAFAQERIRCAVTLAMPHPRTLVAQLRSPAQLRASWYMALFQLPGSPWLAARDDFALVDRLWRTWSPGFTLPGAERAALHAMLAQSMPAPLEYYRDARRHARKLLALDVPLVCNPLLALHGGADGCVVPPSIDDGERFAAPYERETIPGLGHFLHLEDPARVAARVAEFLA